MTARIEDNAFVVLDYKLRNGAGEVVDASDAEDGEPIEYVHGYDMLVPGLEKGLVGLSVGDTKDIEVSPEDGFGERDESLVVEVARSEMPSPDEVEVGDEMVAESEDGDEAEMHVVEVRENTVLLDGNHPLAGQTLRYSVIVREVRAATEEEIAEAQEDLEDGDHHAHDHDHDPVTGECIPRGQPN